MTRKINSDVQLGAREQPSVPRTKIEKVQNRTGRRPILSLKGLQTRGPIQYPIKKIEFGNTFWLFPDMLKSCMMVGTALLGREEDMPLLSTTKSASAALYNFLLYQSILRIFNPFIT
jgi:hypothetical protein